MNESLSNVMCPVGQGYIRFYYDEKVSLCRSVKVYIECKFSKSVWVLTDKVA
jgi:hypothetical protein